MDRLSTAWAAGALMLALGCVGDDRNFGAGTSTDAAADAAQGAVESGVANGGGAASGPAGDGDSNAAAQEAEPGDLPSDDSTSDSASQDDPTRTMDAAASPGDAPSSRDASIVSDPPDAAVASVPDASSGDSSVDGSVTGSGGMSGDPDVGSAGGGASSDSPSGGGGAGQGGTSPGGAGQGGEAPTERLELGEVCLVNEECVSRFCVDGVCCEAACDSTCAECDGQGSEGTCTLADRDDACGDLQCPQDTECRSYQAVDDANCAAVGQCAQEASCAQQDATMGTTCQAGAGTCDGAGQCVVPDKAALGETCSNAEDCGSGYCAETASGAQVCCNSACTGVCQACSSAGFCGDTPADDARCDPVVCPVDSTCADYPDALTQDRCVGFGQCATVGTHCSPSYAASSVSCGVGMFCDGQGSCEDACSGTELWCDACIDPDTDDENCGDCDNACQGTSSCVAGECRCPNVGEQLCSGSCVNTTSDPSNCGSCGRSCAAATAAGSSRVCTGGQCGFCGGYAQDCCAPNGSCGAGLSCSGGTCDCPSATHRCPPDSSSGSCVSDGDAAACGPQCVDCREPNVQASCNLNQCDNSCASGIFELCEPVSGKPECGAWDFESNTLEGWELDPTSVADGFTLQVGNVAESGSHSLAIPFDSTTTGGYRAVYVRVPLCSSGAEIDWSGHTVSASLRFVTASGAEPLDEDKQGGYQRMRLYTGASALNSYNIFKVNNTTGGGSTAGSWYHFQDDGTLFGAPAVGTHVGFNLGVSDWKGTIYIDKFEIR